MSNPESKAAPRVITSNPAKTGFDLNALMNRDIKLFSFKFKDKHKEAFYLELSTLLSAGLDIKSALDLIEDEQTNKDHGAIIGKLTEELVGGYALWETMQRSGHFTPYEYFAVQIGEETGKLIVVLDQLHNYFATRLKQRRQLVNALSYPVIILLTSVGAVSFMILFIVPMFNDVFKRFGGELPGITKFIIGVSSFLKDNLWLITALMAGIIYYLYRNRNQPWMRQFVARAVRKVPVVGNIVYALQLARFCNSMALLLGSKVPMLRALDLVRQMITFHPIQQTLAALEDDILHGQFLHHGMSRFSVYDKRLVSLIKIGEEVNKLDVFFDKMAKQYSSDAEHQTGLLNTFLEPAMIIFLGVVVGFILLAMYLPMFEMSTSVGR